MSDQGSPFHRGEKEIQARLGVGDRIERLGRRMIRDHMPDEPRAFFSRLPLFVVAAADTSGRPWASALVGRPGFLEATDDRSLEVKAHPAYGDVLERALVEGAEIGGLGIEPATHSRVRLNGWLQHADKDGFRIRVSQCFGNCGQYIHARTIAFDATTQKKKRPVRCGKSLNKAEAAMIARADTFFIASQFGASRDEPNQGIDVSHRGGRPGFVIVAHESLLLFPDYSGNCMFNTLGNLMVDPRCGLAFIDFSSGDLLQVSGEAETLWEPYHVSRFPGAKRVVAFTIEETRYVERAFPIVSEFLSPSDTFEALTEPERTAPEPHTPMTLLSVNVSGPKEIATDGKTVSTGIFKQPVEGRIMLRRLNLDGDGQADLWGHGGAFRAVYVFSTDGYDYWTKKLQRDFPPGGFGENFTVSGMPDDEVCVGDVYRIGGALVEVSQPRIPCYKLALKLGIPDFQKRFLDARRVGFYLRVIEEGEVGAGDPIELIGRDEQPMTVRRVNDLLFFDTNDLEGAREALSIPALAHGWKGSFEERLAKADAASKADDGFRPFRVGRKTPESETITSFTLAPEDGKPLGPFLPGQFLTFRLAIPGRSDPVMRTYSISDAPNPDHYRVSIKRETAPSDAPEAPPGLSSTFFHDQVAPDTVLQVAPPRGKFHLDPDSDRTVVLLSAGVGLTPMVAMASALTNGNSKRRVWFVHGARNGREHAMGRLMRDLAKRNDNLRVHIRYSQPDETDVSAQDYDSAGRVDIALLKDLLPFDDYEFYLCGPTAFMRALYCGLLATGVAETRIHYEFFGPGSLLCDEAPTTGAASPPAAESELTGAVQVTFARSGLTVPWDPAAETILDLAEQNGLSPAYSCRSGICQTCICDMIEGDVEYVEEPLNAPAAGRALICIARPKGPLTVDV